MFRGLLGQDCAGSGSKMTILDVTLNIWQVVGIAIVCAINGAFWAVVVRYFLDERQRGRYD